MKHLPTALIAALAVTATAHAESVVFSADFDADVPGLNTSPAGFNLTRGNTDLLGDGPNGLETDLQPGNGYYVSLVGSGSGAAGLSTDQIFEAGEYELTFDLAGNNQGATDELVEVSLGSFTESIQLLAANAFDPFSGQSFSFITDVAGTLNFDTFDSPGVTDGDDLGALIDNVVLSLVDDGSGIDSGTGIDGGSGDGAATPTAVPTPSAAVAGLAMLGLAFRRRRA